MSTSLFKISHAYNAMLLRSASFQEFSPNAAGQNEILLCSLVCSSTLTLGKLTVSVLNEHIRCILFRDFQLLMKVSSAHATKSNEFVRSVDK